jgi:REP element-mobilizing transposase RayT
MRQRRIKVPPEEGEAMYHCMSRTVNGEWLFKPVDREVFRKQLWLVADYCGLQVLTYTILSNHFHVLVRVPQSQGIFQGQARKVKIGRKITLSWVDETKTDQSATGRGRSDVPLHEPDGKWGMAF